MKRIELTGDQLNQLVKLKQGGKNWTDMGKALNIDHRIAKKNYLTWEKEQSKKELAAARINVVGEALREHIDNIVKLATYLSIKLDLPTSPRVKMTSSEFINSLWETDILGQADLCRSLSIDKPREKEFIRRSNKLLYKSLLLHTQEGNVLSSLEDWGNAWNNSLRLIMKFRDNMTEMIRNFLNQQKIIVEQVVDGTEKEDPIGGLVDVIVESFWHNLLNTNEDIKIPWVNLNRGLITKTQSHSKVNVQATIKVNDNVVIKLTDPSEANKLIKIVEITMSNMHQLNKDTVFKTVRNNFATMEKAIDYLKELLNPIAMRPMVIRSKCDQCPF